MRPLELSDLVPPTRPRSSALPSFNRKGKGSKARGTEQRRGYINNIGKLDLSAHFNMKLNVVDEMREAFSFVGTVGPVTHPPQVIEIETSGVREIVHESIVAVQSKVKENFFTAEFEPALQHVTAHLVAAKMQFAHSGSATGTSQNEELPSAVRMNEHVRMTSTTTLIGIAQYIDSIGRFEIEGVRYTPYLRELVHADSVQVWLGSHFKFHHLPQLYTETYRQTLAQAVPGNAAIVAQMENPENYLRMIMPGNTGRDLVRDLATVRFHLEKLSQKFPKCVRAVDVTTGTGSLVQAVAYEPPDGYEPARIWSPLSVEAMDLYIGAAFGFCTMWPGVPLPPALHQRVAKSQIHAIKTGAITTWLSNLMSRG